LALAGTRRKPIRRITQEIDDSGEGLELAFHGQLESLRQTNFTGVFRRLELF